MRQLHVMADTHALGRTAMQVSAPKVESACRRSGVAFELLRGADHRLNRALLSTDRLAAYVRRCAQGSVRELGPAHAHM